MNMNSNANSSKRYVSLAQGGGASSSSGNALGQQASATAGSNKAQWNAMDLHIGSGARFQQQIGGGHSTRSSIAAGSTVSSSGMKVDDSGLSARNILIRRKLMERKRFDSADYAMNKRQEEAATPGAMPGTGGPASSYNNSSSSSRAVDEQARFLQSSSSNTQAATRAMPTTANAPFAPAQVGASVFFSALGGDENVDMDAKMDPAAQIDNASSSTSKEASNPKSYSTNAATAAAARGANRYGNLPGPAGGALSARNILLQKKLREKKHFDSADWQLAQIQSASPSTSPTEALPPSSTDGNSSVGGDEHDGASPMEIDLTPVNDPVESINSPSAASVALRNRVNAQMSPSVRGGKYGNGMSGANVLLARKLSEKKRFDSADYHMEAVPVAAAKAKQSFFVTAATSNAPEPPATSGSNASISAPPAPQAISSSTASGSGSKYGKLSAVNVLIRKKLKERKRFDSADYAMEKQGRRQPLNGGQGGSSGALQGGHVVMRTPMAHSNVYMVDASSSQAAEENKSISHQVKHIKLSEEGGGWSTRVPAAVANSVPGSSSSPSSAVMPKSSAAMSQDSRLVARNLIIQRKLSERKRFDSADYFKEAAKRGHS